MGIGTLLSRVHDDRSSLGSRGLEPGRVRGGVDGQGGRTEITGLWTRGLRLSRGRVRGVKPLQCRGRCLCPGPWDLRAGAGLALLPGAGRGWAGQRGRPRARQRGRAAPGMFNRAVSRLSRKRPPSGNGDGAATPGRARGRSRRGSAGPGCAVLRAALPGARRGKRGAHGGPWAPAVTRGRGRGCSGPLRPAESPEAAGDARCGRAGGAARRFPLSAEEGTGLCSGCASADELQSELPLLPGPGPQPGTSERGCSNSKFTLRSLPLEGAFLAGTEISKE